jgi:hypothetical protein
MIAIRKLFRNLDFCYVGEIDATVRRKVAKGEKSDRGGEKNVDDYRACAELCEENGFPRQAALFRALGSGRKAYVVVERGTQSYPHDPDQLSLDERGEPRAIYLDREQADRAAALWNARKFREHNVARFCYDVQDLDSITELDAEELAGRVGEILGREVDPDELLDRDVESSFFASATDPQMMEIAGLFTMRFFDVVEVSFAV